MYELLFSFDGEMTGPQTGKHAMVSLGVVAYVNQEKVGTFYENIEPFEGYVDDPEVRKNFWDKHPKAWAATLENRKPAQDVMYELVHFVETQRRLYPFPYTGMARPALFDGKFIDLYFLEYGIKQSPFDGNIMDLKSWVAGYYQVNMQRASELIKKAERRVNKPLPHLPHLDSEIQAELFFCLKNQKEQLQ